MNINEDELWEEVADIVNYGNEKDFMLSDKIAELKIKFTIRKNKLFPIVAPATHSVSIAKLNDTASLPSKSPSDGQDWISVKDRLPEIGEYVLANVGVDTVLKGRLMNNGWVAFFSDGEKLVGDIRPVTHWQPLPEPPKIN